MFQGGFAGIETIVTGDNSKETFYFKDSNELQSITFKAETSKLKIEFIKSSDFFGRIIVYQLNL